MSSIVSVYQAKTQEEMQVVYQLAHDNFVEKNLCLEQENRLLMNNQKLDEHRDTMIFLAKTNGEIRGTISITIHDKIEDVYNYLYFSSLLEKHYSPGLPSYSGWRLATKGNPLERYLLILSLIIHGNQIGLTQGLPQAYFSFIPAQLKVYKNLFPQGEILGAVQKKTDLIDTELILMKYRPTEEGIKHLAQLRTDLIKRYFKKAT